MECQLLFSGENEKNFSKVCLLNFLPSMQSAKTDSKLKPHNCKFPKYSFILIVKMHLTLKVPCKIVADDI